jgi:hypothetical protein
LALGLGIALMGALPGCVASAEGSFVADYPAEYVDTVPPRIEYYPRTYYRGNPAYLVDGRWYYRTHDRWVVFREEPSELRAYRVRREPAYLAPQNRYGRSQERQIAERRAEQHREAERRAEEDRRRARADARRAEEHRRFEQQRQAQQRAEEDRRLAERRGRATRKRDRSHGDQQDTRDERDRRHYRQD